MKKNNGFSFVWLLFILATISVLISVVVFFLSNSQKKASVISTKTSLSLLSPAIIKCCSNSTNTINTTAGKDLCLENTGVILPTALQLKSKDPIIYSIIENCGQSNPTLSVTLAGHPEDNCNDAWVITKSGVKPPTGC